jgi:protein-S-isoprenylcysteine O-methyltransferase Ste14
MNFEVTIAICWVTFMTVWLVMGVAEKQPLNHSVWGPGAWVMRLVLGISILAALRIAGPEAFQHNLDSSLEALAGTVLTIAGIGVAIWARVFLGRNWGMPMTRAQQAQLITRGPYRWVRHPIYSGLLLALIGTCTALSHWILMPAGLLAAYFIYSAGEEEKYLLQKFGDQYRDYMSRSKMLVPWMF